MEIKVSKGVKLPKIRPHKKRKYPFDTMKVGDSFECDIDSRESVCAASIGFSKKYKAGKWKFTVNKISETKVLVTRKK
jgi:hypothetical protein